MQKANYNNEDEAQGGFCMVRLHNEPGRFSLSNKDACTDVSHTNKLTLADTMDSCNAMSFFFPPVSH